MTEATKDLICRFREFFEKREEELFLVGAKAFSDFWDRIDS